MSEARNKLAAIAATVSVASSLVATTTADVLAKDRADGRAIAAAPQLAETRNSQTRDGTVSGAKTSPGVTTSPVNKATSPPGAVWSDKDKSPQGSGEIERRR